MLGKQHLEFGIVTAVSTEILLKSTDLPVFSNPVLFIGLAMAGSLLPDIDDRDSIISKICIIPFYKLIKYHRGITHDLFTWTIISYFLFVYYPSLFGLCFGVLGHLLLDSFTSQGIPLIWILNKYLYLKHPDTYKNDIFHARVHILPFKFLRLTCDSFMAKLVTYGLSISYLYLIFTYINQISDVLIKICNYVKPNVS